MTRHGQAGAEAKRQRRTDHTRGVTPVSRNVRKSTAGDVDEIDGTGELNKKHAGEVSLYTLNAALGT